MVPSVVAAPIVVDPCFTVKVTDPLLIAGPLAGVIVAFRVTDVSPYVALALEMVVVVLPFVLKVAVRLWALLFIENVHGDVVPVHVVVPPPANEPVQPANTEPALGVAVIEPIALLFTL